MPNRTDDRRDQAAPPKRPGEEAPRRGPAMGTYGDTDEIRAAQRSRWHENQDDERPH